VSPPRLAIVHERFTEVGGSERVVEQLHQLWPDAPIYAAVIDRASLPASLRHADLRPSRLQRLYRGGRGYAHLLPLLPAAMSSLDVGDVDLVITSHHAFANRVRPRRGIPVLSYTHTPARWLWEPSMRRGEAGGVAGGLALAAFAATQRRPDARAAGRLTAVAVNSRHVARRVDEWWHRSSTVIPPPVDVDRFTPALTGRREPFFLTAGRLVPYKQPEIAVTAARRAGVRLVVAGGGRSLGAVRQAAGADPDIEVLGDVDDAVLVDLYRRCQALVFPGEEDFGIVPVEAQACGTPVIARKIGGVLDSVVDGSTGVLYDPVGTGGREGEIDALAAALRSFDTRRFDARVIRTHAESFAGPRFRHRIAEWVEASLGTA
jgi:glycosyltransferase involved in cell wall biosynthesis